MKLFTKLGFFALAVGAMILTSCSKQEESNNFEYQTQTTIEQQRAAEQLMGQISELGVWNEERGQLYKFNLQTREFSFADANDGWNFSNSEGPVFIENPEGGGILIIPSFSFGSNTGGTVVAGNSALDITYTFCFSASDEALGLDLFDYGGNFDGVSMVLGIAGDFEALADGDVDEDSDFTDFFQGFCLYFVYDNEAQGSYEILDWFDNLEDDLDNLDEKGFGYLIDFVNFSVYFTSEGTLDVSGGQISFTGEYFGILEILDNLEDDTVDFDIVPGFGAMGCS
ncbi:MAG: hypothetical protein MK081_00640 [Flavobacteriales bacterium]|nr:hypothetical protein [Flavobacteriales bacterium]